MYDDNVFKEARIMIILVKHSKGFDTVRKVLSNPLFLVSDRPLWFVGCRHSKATMNCTNDTSSGTNVRFHEDYHLRFFDTFGCAPYGKMTAESIMHDSRPTQSATIRRNTQSGDPSTSTVYPDCCAHLEAVRRIVLPAQCCCRRVTVMGKNTLYIAYLKVETPQESDE